MQRWAKWSPRSPPGWRRVTSENPTGFSETLENPSTVNQCSHLFFNIALLLLWLGLLFWALPTAVLGWGESIVSVITQDLGIKFHFFSCFYMNLGIFDLRIVKNKGWSRWRRPECFSPLPSSCMRLSVTCCWSGISCSAGLKEFQRSCFLPIILDWKLHNWNRSCGFFCFLATQAILADPGSYPFQT